MAVRASEDAVVGAEADWMGVDPGTAETDALVAVVCGMAAATVAEDVHDRPPSHHQVSTTGTCPPCGGDGSSGHGCEAGGTGHGSGTDSGTTCRQPALIVQGADAQYGCAAHCVLER